MATPAPACSAALKEATSLWPNRSRLSDGICGDPRHAARTSDHNPDGDGYCCAFDLTHDPANGCDAHHLADLLRRYGDPRVKYAISNKRIWNPSVSPNWRPYTGSNPHSKHIHVSVVRSGRFNTAAWWRPLLVLAKREQRPEAAPPLPEEDDLTPDESRILTEIHNSVKLQESVFGERSERTIAALESIAGRLDAVATQLEQHAGGSP